MASLRLPAGLFVALALAASLTLRFTTPGTVSWAIAAALFLGFLAVAAFPFGLMASLGDRIQPREAWLVLPNALLPLSYAMFVAFPDFLSWLGLLVVVLMLRDPLVFCEFASPLSSGVCFFTPP